MQTIGNNKFRTVFAISVLLLGMSFSSILLATHYPEPGDPIAGAKVWADTCSRCHNARDPADLRDDQWITTAFHMRMRAGLTGQQTRDVLTFMQDSNVPITVEPLVFENGPASKMAASASTMSGAEVYSQTCVACHGKNGKGTVPGAPNFTSADGPMSQSDELLFQRIKLGFKSPGSAMGMPPKGGNMNLTDSDIEAVVKYLRDTFSK